MITPLYIPTKGRWADAQAAFRPLVADINAGERTAVTVGNGDIVLTQDYGLWVDGELESHPALGPGQAARDARQRNGGG